MMPEWISLLDWWWVPLLLVGFVWTPKTWSPGELVSAAAMNTNIRDHLNEGLRTQATTLTGTQNNVAIDGPFAYLKSNSASALTITGALIDSGNVDGARIIIEALVSAVTIKHQNGSSTTSNRIITPDAGDLVLAVGERAALIYDGTATRWRANRAGMIDHGSLIGRTDDDHVRYLDGRADKCRVYNNADIPIANASYVYLTFNSEVFDDNSLHSTGSNTGRITIPTTGKYIFGCNILWEVGTGSRLVEVFKNRSSSHLRDESYGDGTATPNLAQCPFALDEFSAADYLEVRVYQNSGGELDVQNYGSASPYFWAARID